MLNFIHSWNSPTLMPHSTTQSRNQKQLQMRICKLISSKIATYYVSQKISEHKWEAVLRKSHYIPRIYQNIWLAKTFLRKMPTLIQGVSIIYKLRLWNRPLQRNDDVAFVGRLFQENLIIQGVTYWLTSTIFASENEKLKKHPRNLFVGIREKVS